MIYKKERIPVLATRLVSAFPVPSREFLKNNKNKNKKEKRGTKKQNFYAENGVEAPERPESVSGSASEVNSGSDDSIHSS